MIGVGDFDGRPLTDEEFGWMFVLTLVGGTYQTDAVFENVVRYIEAGEIRPLIAKAYPLAEIATAQEDFLTKTHTGQLVLVPPQE